MDVNVKTARFADMNDFYDKLDELYKTGDLAAVEAYLKSEVALADDKTPKQAGLLNELAGFYRGVSRYAESKEAFDKALSIFESAGMSATPQYATVLLNLAGLYRLQGDVDEAINLFINAMKKLEEADESDSYAYVSILNNLALALQSKGEFVSALEYAEKALDKMRQHDGNDHEIATSLNNLASINLNLGQLNEAAALISESLKIYDSMPEPDVHLAAALTTNAVIMARNGNHIDSLKEFRRALELTEVFFGENIEFAICKRNISDVCELIGDNQAAISELSDSIRVFEKLLGSNHATVKSAKTKLEMLIEKEG